MKSPDLTKASTVKRHIVFNNNEPEKERTGDAEKYLIAVSPYLRISASYSKKEAL
jgi:hypothetical protein